MFGLQRAVELQPFLAMFQIRRSEIKDLVTFTLSGRIDEEQVVELQKLLEGEAGGSSTAVVLDLADVRLVDRDAVKFLADCEAGGVQLRNCPPYVREWIGNRERLTP
jgi:anti-anti-sigma regulatory factor